jgi:hypothetical protein
MTKEIDLHHNPKFRSSGLSTRKTEQFASLNDGTSAPSGSAAAAAAASLLARATTAVGMDSSRSDDEEGGPGSKRDAALQARERQRELERERDRERRRKLEAMASDECVLCGEFMINSVTEQFVSPVEADDIASWAV